MIKAKIPADILSAAEALVAPYGGKVRFEPQSPEIREKQFLDIRAATKFCSLSRWTLSRAVRAGQLRCIKVSKGKTGKILFDVNELTRFFRSHS